MSPTNVLASASRFSSPSHHALGLNAIHTYWDRSLPAKLTIEPGDTVTFTTREPSQGGVALDLKVAGEVGGDPELIALIAAIDTAPMATGLGTELGGHALTGPVAVTGAEPGDGLIVEVVSVEPSFWGWTACGPGDDSPFGDELAEWRLHIWDLRGGEFAVFRPGIRVPIDPFCGVMGVAPSAAGKHRTAPPRRVGGNLDIRQLTVGSTLTLPVEVASALFSLGDVHAAQGDGEIAGTAIEIDAVVTLRLDLVKGGAPATPNFALPVMRPTRGPWFATVGTDADPRLAVKQALRGVVEYLQTHQGLTRQEAIILGSACVDLRLSQIVNAGRWTVTAFLPLVIFEKEPGRR